MYLQKGYYEIHVAAGSKFHCAVVGPYTVWLIRLHPVHWSARAGEVRHYESIGNCKRQVVQWFNVAFVRMLLLCVRVPFRKLSQVEQCHMYVGDVLAQCLPLPTSISTKLCTANGCPL